jgi:hypothetical protein
MSEVTIQALPDDVHRRVFDYCDAAALIVLELVCRRWLNICRLHEAGLWTPMISLLWQHRIFNVPAEHNLLKRLESIALTNKSSIPSTVAYYDGMDPLHLLASILESREKVIKNGRTRSSSQQQKQYPPLPAASSICFGICKASYAFAKREEQRSMIMVRELCSIPWRIDFKFYGPMETDEDSFFAHFYPNGTLFSEMSERFYVWRFIPGRDGQRKIQVEHFPPLTSVRQSNGAWQLENMHVTLQQTQSMDGHNLPLFDVNGCPVLGNGSNLCGYY